MLKQFLQGSSNEASLPETAGYMLFQKRKPGLLICAILETEHQV